jgi:membrane protein
MAGTDLASWIGQQLGGDATATRTWTIEQWAIAVLLVVVAIDLVYYFAPNADTPFVWVTPGALLATGLWIAASLGFKLYVQELQGLRRRSRRHRCVIVLMLWFYLSGFALLIVAELNAEIDKALHSRQPQPVGEPKKIGPAADGAG